MLQVVFGVLFPVERHRLDIDILVAILRRIDNQILPVLEMQDSFLEQGSTQYILRCSGSNRIETESGEDVPGGSLPVIFVAAIAVRCRSVHTVHHLT